MSIQSGGMSDTQPPDPEELAETLLDAAASGAFEQALVTAHAQIDGEQDAFAPMQLFRYRLLFFDLAMVSTYDPLIREESATALATSAIEAGEPAWEAIHSSGRLDEIERLALTGERGIELLELLAYAPDAGARGFALSRIQSAGMQALDSGADSRAFERLLHAVGASPDAYRLEAARKQRMLVPADEDSEDVPKPFAPAYRLVAIAGGHAQLRATTTALLQRHGVETVQIPSSREAVRRERDIVQQLQGCDLVVLLVRQITHSTSDQVRKAAERMGVPVMFSQALSAVAIERQLFDR